MHYGNYRNRLRRKNDYSLKQNDMYDSNPDPIAVIVYIGLAIALFLILRVIFLWYWKIDAIVSNQQKTNDLLQKILDSNKFKEQN